MKRKRRPNADFIAGKTSVGKAVEERREEELPQLQSFD
jgi:hypothetical protein